MNFTILSLNTVKNWKLQYLHPFQYSFGEHLFLICVSVHLLFLLLDTTVLSSVLVWSIFLYHLKECWLNYLTHFWIYFSECLWGSAKENHWEWIEDIWHIKFSFYAYCSPWVDGCIFYNFSFIFFNDRSIMHSPFNGRHGYRNER